MNQVYLDTGRLLTRVAPFVLCDDTFALKGGTAINLFVRDMPRLSVDLDLVLPDHTLLDALVEQFGGQENTFNAVQRAVTQQLGNGSGQYSTVVNVGGSNVTVTGAFVNGMPSRLLKKSVAPPTPA